MLVYEKFLKHREIKILSKFSKGPRASNFMLKVLTLCKPRRTDRNAGSLLMAWESLGVWRTEDDEIKFLLIIFYCSNLVLKVICLNLLWWLFNINQALFMTVTIKLFVLLVCSAMRFLVKWARRCFLENFVFSLFSVSCAFCVFFILINIKKMSR